jgi:hypothetical protein
MAKKSTAQKSQDAGEPKFPYTTEPPALGRLLNEIPKRPKPPKITLDTLKAWSVSSNNNARTAINVLKKLGLLNGSAEPTEHYVSFMKTGVGPAVLGQKIKETYKTLFENSHAPHKESQDELRKLFHIHSGGGADSMRLQVNTFKVLADHADFSDTAGPGADFQSGGDDTGASGAGSANLKLPPVKVDLHIHLPENKSTRDYEAIIQDIARYIYGRAIDKA